MSYILIAVVIICATYFFYQKLKRQKEKNPPALGSIPLFGSWFHIKEPFGFQLLENYRDIGVVEVQYGIARVYYLNTADAVKEAMIEKGDAFLGRPMESIAHQLYGKGGGIIMTDGTLWKEYRRFTLKVLRDFGLGRKVAEQMVSNEAQAMINHIQQSLDKPIDTNRMFAEHTSNVICKFVFGYRLASEDPVFDELLENLRNMTMQASSRGNMFALVSMMQNKNLFKVLNMVIKSKSFSKIIENFKALVTYCCKQIEQHKKALDSHGDEPQDYIDAHLMHQQKQNDTSMFTDFRLALSILDLFLAGTDTTSNTLTWALLYMIANPKVAQKVANEIHQNVGTDKEIQLEDKTKLPYVEATLEELHRSVSLVSEGLWHRIMQDVEIDGYLLKKNNIIFMNLIGIHHNPQVFPNPKEFRPERHIGADEKFHSHPDITPFGMGKRSCLGEGLARTELFLFFTSIMQKFTIELDSGCNETAQELVEHPLNSGGQLRVPRPHTIIFKQR